MVWDLESVYGQLRWIPEITGRGVMAGKRARKEAVAGKKTMTRNSPCPEFCIDCFDLYTIVRQDQTSIQRGWLRLLTRLLA